MSNDRPRVAIATGDPAGIGPEISLKAALDSAVNAICRPLVVGDPAILDRHASAAGIKTAFHIIADAKDVKWPGSLNVLATPMPEIKDLAFGTNSAASGRASLASASRAIRAALAGDVDAVVAAPQNETSIAAAGIAFDGYPSFVARETGVDKDDVFRMLCFGDKRIAHCTLMSAWRKP